MKYIIGIDEVGRGPLAGPVTVGVVACKANVYTKLKKLRQLPLVGKDSKKLSVADREKYSKILQLLAEEEAIYFSIIHISNTVVDSRGISFAIRKAMADGLKKIQKRVGFNPRECDLRLDGGLRAPREFTHQKTIIKGDEKEKIIAWASILAKVSRDRVMVQAGKKFPQYGFEIHKGYGTSKHREAIRTHGLSHIHRKTFCRSLV